MSRVLVTGASGFIGRRLLPVLVAGGHSVVAATRRPEALGDLGTKVILLNLADRKTFAALPRDVDVVVHAAAGRLDSETNWNGIAEMVRVNMLGTLNMLEYSESCGIKRFVYCSTMSVYALPQPVPICEDGPTYPAQGLDSFYGISKLGGELVCARLQQEGRLACQCLRLGRVYGPEESPQSLLSLWVREASEGKEIVVYSDGERSMDFIYIDDVIRGIIAAIESNWAGGVLNLGSGVETTWRRLAEAIVEVFSPPEAPARVRYVSAVNSKSRSLDVSQRQTVLGFLPRLSLKDGLLSWRSSNSSPISGQSMKPQGSSLSNIQRHG